jgi:cbb3-type cytochrome oxidase subunit 3
VHHRAYDRFGFVLAPHIGRAFRKERKHAREHASRAKLKAALDGKGWT